MTTALQHVVLDPEIEPRQVVDHFERRGWPHVRSEPATDLLSQRIVFEPPLVGTNREISFQYQRDMEMPYLEFRGEALEPEITAARESLPCFPLPALDAPLSASLKRDEAMDQIYAAALDAVRTRFSAPHFAFITSGLEHPDRQVRRASVYATVWLEWPEFVEVMERLWPREVMSVVREDMRVAIVEIRRSLGRAQS